MFKLRRLGLVLLLLLNVTIAEEATEAESAEAKAPSDAEAAPAQGGEGGDDAKGQQFVDSARELQEKLAQLKALLDAKGDSADPGLKEKLSGLESQLKGLGLDGLGGGGGSDPEVTQLLVACSDMAMRKLGIQRPSTIGSLRKLADNKLPPEVAAKDELWRMTAVCINELTEADFTSFKSGRLKVMPKAHVDAAKQPEAEQKVLEIQSQVWDELRQIAELRLKELLGGDDTKLNMSVAYFAFIPLGIMGFYLFRLFRQQQLENSTKASSKKKRKNSDAKSD